MATTYPDAATLRLVDLCTANLRAPASAATDTVTGPVLTFEPPLTTAEQTTFTDLLAMAKAGVVLTFAEYQAVKPDLAGLRTYAGIASPTLVQTVSAVKAQSRVLRALLRDG